MRLLVSLPYSNNQWVYQWIQQSEKLNYRTIVLPSDILITGKKVKPIYAGHYLIKYTTSEEISGYVNDDFLKDTYNSFSLEEKIDFIETNKKFGLDVCYNCETSDLFLPYKSKLLWNWFKDFYKKDTVLQVLLNKNLWKHWIKFLFYRTIFLKLPTLTDNDLITNTRSVWNADLVKSYIEKNNISFVYKEDIWKDFLKNLRLLHEDIIGFKHTKAYSSFAKEILWLEDLSSESLSLKYECSDNLNNIMIPSRLNYESYFSMKDLDFMKKQFDTYKENEFIYYGYK